MLMVFVLCRVPEHGIPGDIFGICPLPAVSARASAVPLVVWVGGSVPDCDVALGWLMLLRAAAASRATLSVWAAIVAALAAAASLRIIAATAAACALAAAIADVATVSNADAIAAASAAADVAAIVAVVASVRAAIAASAPTADVAAASASSAAVVAFAPASADVSRCCCCCARESCVPGRFRVGAHRPRCLLAGVDGGVIGVAFFLGLWVEGCRSSPFGPPQGGPR